MTNPTFFYATQAISQPATVCLGGDCMTQAQVHAINHPYEGLVGFLTFLFQGTGFLVWAALAGLAVWWAVRYAIRLHEMLAWYEAPEAGGADSQTKEEANQP